MRCDPFSLTTKDETAPFEVIKGRENARLIVTCDHASNRLPAEYGGLGLAPAAFDRHIAYDIGMRGVTLGLAEKLGATAVLSRFSRLLIDPNRGEDDPTLVMRLSDGAIVPGNAHVDAAEVQGRLNAFHRPYHDAITAKIEAVLARGETPVVVAMHSFTPRWKAYVRPWHIGLLWDRDGRLAVPMLESLRHEPDIVVGDNEPYDGALVGDAMHTHGTQRGLPHVLVEIRQDLVADAAGQGVWADIMARHLEPLLDLPETMRIERYGSRADIRSRNP